MIAAGRSALARYRKNPTPTMKVFLVTLFFAAATTVASAQLANPSFETGDFTGWIASGDTASVRSPADEYLIGIPPLDGEFYAALLSDSSIFQTGIHLHAGETVSAWMNGSQAGGFLHVNRDGGPLITVPWEAVFHPGTPFPYKWNQISFKIQEDGIYSIGASSPERDGGPSFFGVDRFTITAVPEPSSFGLLAAVLGLSVIMWRRREISAAAATSPRI